MVSVCMSAYNGEKYIGRQVESILKQLGKDDELIIYDDFSTDNTKNIIKNIKDGRLKIIEGEENRGFLYGFQKAMSLIHGDYVLLSDQDDIWCDDKVKVILTAFENSDCDCVVHDAVVVNEDLDTIEESLYHIMGISKNPYRNFIKNTFTGACIALKASVIDMLIPIPKEAVYHDRWIALILGMKGRTIKIIDDKLIYYVRHDGTATKMKRKGITHIIADRIRLLKCIVGKLM